MIFDPFQSSSSPFQQVLLYHSNSGMHLYTKWKMPIFDPIDHGYAAVTASGCQMMSYSHEEKDLNGNEHLNLNLE